VRAAVAIVLLAGCASGSAGNVRLTAQEERILRPLGDPPDKVRRLVAEGDQYFLKGIPPWRESDPETNTDWTRNVATAFDLYTKARSNYLAAQGEFSGFTVPPPLLDRVNECVARLAVLERRRRSVPR
jgi:hypothetical protein